MTGWQETRIGDHIKIKHGYAFEGAFITDMNNRNILVTPGNFNIGGGFKSNKFKYFSGTLPEDYIFQPKDLMVTMTDLSKEGDSLGYPAFVPFTEGVTYLHNQRVGKVIFENELIDKGFLYYLLCTKEYRDEILASATGTSIKHTSPKRIESFSALMPPITEQRAIAAVLGALDDKIELNRRMNATLEATAWVLFKSWFVDFDPVKSKMAGNAPFGMDAATAALFPARLIESDLGDIPEGWRVSTIGELGRVVTGKTPSTADPENFGNDIPFITIPDLNGRMYISSTQRYLSKVGAQKVSSSIIPKGAVMMSCIATVGLCGIAETASVTNQQINSLICKEGVSLPCYVYWQFRNITNDVISSGGGGSVYTNVSKSRFENIKVLCSDYRVQELFDQDWFKKLRENEAENAKLAKLRDYLLPKLISGEIRIPDAEKFVEWLV